MSKRWWTLSVLCLSLLLIAAANTSLTVAIPAIQRGLGVGPSGIQWVVDAYSLVFAGLLLPAGALADRFGRKTALQGGLVLFAVFSAAATFATAGWQLIVYRSLMGVGAAFIMPGTLSTLANVFPIERERRRAIAIWAGCAGLGGSLGPLVSGVLLAHFWWGSTFLVGVPIAAVALVAGWWLVPNSADPKEAQLDPVGAVLAVAGLVSVVYGIVEAPNQGWGDPTTVGAIGLGLAVLGVFVWWERRVEHPMLDVRLFTQRGFVAGSTTITLQYVTLYGLFFAAPMYLQIAHGYSAVLAAATALPLGIAAMIGAPLSARTVARYGPRRVVTFGLILSGTGLGLLRLAGVDTPIALLLVIFALVGIGVGQTTAPSTTLIMSAVPRAKSGVGSAVNDLSRELGGAMGIAVLGSLITSFYRSGITGHLGVLPTSAHAHAASSVTATLGAARRVAANGRSGAAQTLVHHAQASFAHAFAVTMLVACGVAVANLLLMRALQRRGDQSVPVEGVEGVEGVEAAVEPVEGELPAPAADLVA